MRYRPVAESGYITLRQNMVGSTLSLTVSLFQPSASYSLIIYTTSARPYPDRERCTSTFLPPMTDVELHLSRSCSEP